MGSSARGAEERGRGWRRGRTSVSSSSLSVERGVAFILARLARARLCRRRGAGAPCDERDGRARGFVGSRSAPKCASGEEEKSSRCGFGLNAHAGLTRASTTRRSRVGWRTRAASLVRGAKVAARSVQRRACSVEDGRGGRDDAPTEERRGWQQAGLLVQRRGDGRRRARRRGRRARGVPRVSRARDTIGNPGGDAR